MHLKLMFLGLFTVTRAWTTPTRVTYRRSLNPLKLAPVPLEFSSSSLILSDDSNNWRQYVPLVVSLMVITDILLGSPVANSILAPMKQVKEEIGSEQGYEDPAKEEARRRERVDTDRIAQEALGQAYAFKENREYLEKNKSADQRMQEIRNSMDNDMKQIDQVLGERQKKLDAGEF